MVLDQLDIHILTIDLNKKGERIQILHVCSVMPDSGPGDPLPGRSLPSVNGPNPGGFCSVGPSASGLPLEVLYLGGSWGCPSLSLGQAQELDGGWEEEADGWAWNPSSPLP